MDRNLPGSLDGGRFETPFVPSIFGSLRHWRHFGYAKGARLAFSRLALARPTRGGCIDNVEFAESLRCSLYEIRVQIARYRVFRLGSGVLAALFDVATVTRML